MAGEHAVVLGNGEQLRLADLPSALQSSRSDLLAVDELNLAQVETTLIRKALAEAGENRTLAAKKLGISRRTLHRHLSRLGILKNFSQALP